MQALKPLIKKVVWSKDFDDNCNGQITHHTIKGALGNGFYTYDVYCKTGGVWPVAHGYDCNLQKCIEKAHQGFTTKSFR